MPHIGGGLLVGPGPLFRGPARRFTPLAGGRSVDISLGFRFRFRFRLRFFLRFDLRLRDLQSLRVRRALDEKRQHGLAHDVRVLPREADEVHLQLARKESPSRRRSPRASPCRARRHPRKRRLPPGTRRVPGSPLSPRPRRPRSRSGPRATSRWNTRGSRSRREWPEGRGEEPGRPPSFLTSRASAPHRQTPPRRGGSRSHRHIACSRSADEAQSSRPSFVPLRRSTLRRSP